MLPELLTFQPKFKQFVQENCMKTWLSICCGTQRKQNCVTDCALDDAGE